MGPYCERNRLRIESFRISRSTDTPGVLEAGVLRNRNRLRFGARRVETADVRGELAAVVEIDFGVPLRASFAGALSSVTVRETFLLGLSDRFTMTELCKR